MTHWGSHKLDVQEFDGSAATEQDIWDPGSNKRYALTHLQVSVQNAGKLRVFDHSNESGNRFINLYMPGNGVVVREFEAKSGRISGGQGNVLRVVHDGGGIVTVLAEGFTRADR